MNTRFQPGQSGNPRGRPRETKNALTLLRKVLQERIIVSENGRRKSVTKGHALTIQLVNSALQGKFRPLQFLFANQIPKLTEHEERRSSERPNETMPGDSVHLFAAAVDYALRSGAVPPKLLAILRAQAKAQVTTNGSRPAFDVEVGAWLPPSTPEPTPDIVLINKKKPRR
jgi:hypothetical protein